MAAERAKRMGLKKRLLGWVPGIGHYKIEEGIREWDRSIRDEAVMHLTRCEEALNDMLAAAVNLRDRTRIAKIEESRKDIHTLKERVKTQAYGYFPRFSEIKVDRKALERMLDLDDQITDHASSLASSLEARRNNPQPEEPFEPTAIKRTLQPIGELLMEREKISRTGLTEK